MAITNYYSVTGQVIGERISAGSRTNYAVDALGSVTGTLVGDSLQNAYSYKPYGSVLDRTGAGPDPWFLWGGSVGYQSTVRAWTECYVRARHLSTALSQWTTRDDSWPLQPPYRYLNNNPLLATDPSGFGPPTEPCPSWVEDRLGAFLTTWIVTVTECESACIADVLFDTTIHIRADVDLLKGGELAGLSTRPNLYMSCKADFSHDYKIQTRTHSDCPGHARCGPDFRVESGTMDADKKHTFYFTNFGKLEMGSSKVHIDYELTASGFARTVTSYRYMCIYFLCGGKKVTPGIKV